MKLIDNIFNKLTKKYKFLNKFRILTKYLVFSVIATVIDILLLYVFTEFYNIKYFISNIISSGTGLIINYTGQRKYTFKSSKKIRYEFTNFFIVSLIGFLLNTILLVLFVEVFNFYYIYSKIIVIFLVFIWNYLVNKNLTFK